MLFSVVFLSYLPAQYSVTDFPQAVVPSRRRSCIFLCSDKTVTLNIPKASPSFFALSLCLSLSRRSSASYVGAQFSPSEQIQGGGALIAYTSCLRSLCSYSFTARHFFRATIQLPLCALPVPIFLCLFRC